MCMHVCVCLVGGGGGGGVGVSSFKSYVRQRLSVMTPVAVVHFVATG